MYQLWAVSAQDGGGNGMYGPDYTDVKPMSRLHHKSSSSTNCDNVSEILPHPFVARALKK